MIRGPESIAETVKDIVVQMTELRSETLILDAPIDTIGLDSLDVVKLAARLEETFSITITINELMAVKTLGDIVEGIGRKLAG